MATTYSLTLANNGNTSFEEDWLIGTHQIKAKFLWAIVTQEQSDLLEQYNTTLAQSDPLELASGGYNRDYDYINYYISLYGVDLIEWIASNPDLPNSVAHKEDWEKISIIGDRITECMEINTLRKEFREAMRWQVTLIEGEEITSCVIEPGGWFRYPNEHWAIRFVSDLTYIGLNDLGQVTVECEVYDEEST